MVFLPSPLPFIFSYQRHTARGAGKEDVNAKNFSGGVWWRPFLYFVLCLEEKEEAVGVLFG